MISTWILFVFIFNGNASYSYSVNNIPTKDECIRVATELQKTEMVKRYSSIFKDSNFFFDCIETKVRK
jgi:hypothetical protein